ncbi:aldo/keto reductase [Sphingomonas sp. EC-HK361]|uniref:aldo/keto reductase n=1 Tax=Sphingomonas sp. EC-HK361 TaxID=2038397 RepID=UPI00125FE3BD|nr:aldo/keto reductase [Sphingomonas sp. EC-HK361]
MSEIALSPDSRPLGKSGIMVSPIAWGMWRFAGRSADEARALIEAAFAAGITLFDTADIYGFDGEGGFGDAELLLGEVFAATPGLRDRMVLATKGGITPPVPYDSSREYLMRALDNSLRRMRVEQVDLYQIHRPDILAHPQEVARALDDMVASGKVKAVGVSNYSVDQTRTLASFLTVPLVSQQPEFSALFTEPMTNGLFDQAMKHDVAILAWSPLGGGRIADPGTAQERAVAAALDAKAEEAGVSRTAAAYAWIMAHPVRAIPIVGTQNAQRIAEIGDVFKVKWTRTEWYDVLVASRGEKLP